MKGRQGKAAGSTTHHQHEAASREARKRKTKLPLSEKTRQNK